jgi:competence protein ComFC
MANFKPRKIIGVWREGFSLDLHTLSSEFIGHDEFGHPRFDTKRSDIGELLYQLKYKSDTDAVQGIVKVAENFMKAWNPTVDVLVPVPPSTHRAMQPVLVLAKAIGERLGFPMAACVT